MNPTYNLVINIYSIMILIFIYFHGKNHTEKYFLQHKLYMLMVKVTMFMLVIDVFSRFDGHPGTIYSPINFAGNFMIFLLNPILPSLFLLYTHCQVYSDEEKTKRLFSPLIFLNMIYVLILICSQFFGWFYYIDSNNIYHRGSLFWIPSYLSMILAMITFVLIIINRKNIGKKYYLPLVFFPIPPFLCAIWHILFYNMPLTLNSIALSLLIIFFNIQNHSINTDYLTGTYNRNKLEAYMKQKISTCSENSTFSAILVDLNNFKSVNDTYGHDMGDDALQTFVKLVKSCLRTEDFIARFGGDEFCIILDVEEMDDLENTVSRIHDCIEKYNKYSKKPYILGFSIGYAVYDYDSHMEVEEFQKHIDMLMYENKRANRAVKGEYQDNLFYQSAEDI